MANGANEVHKYLKSELENYIKSQYFGKSPLLLSTVAGKLDDEGELYQQPYIESSPAYVSVPNGIDNADIPEWMRTFFKKLADANLGVYTAPFKHQINALETAIEGKDLFVATGTGSGKTECFMWPMMAKLTSEARNTPETWKQRGVRVVVMYPMNALVSDQISRLRRLMGDEQRKFVNIFHETAGGNARRPQFGMYTGRTPYPGSTPDKHQDRALADTLERMTQPDSDEDKDYYATLVKEGKIPAKSNMADFIEELREGHHIPNSEDAELITRFEMQNCCPDILITNYSMLEYMLFRPRESSIWDSTKKWLQEDPNNKLLFIIDEAHMYRGSAGGEVSLLIRRLFHRLGIERNRVQFILTTASMPDATEDDKESVRDFAKALTAADTYSFTYLTGDREVIDMRNGIAIPFTRYAAVTPEQIESNDSSQLTALNIFWKDIAGASTSFEKNEQLYSWLYDHLTDYTDFQKLFTACRGTATSLHDLAAEIFPHEAHEAALNAVSIMLSIAPLARNSKGMVLFPARMHMLFRGIRGVFACANPSCAHSHTASGITLGEILLSDGRTTCPICGSMVYELYNDRKCGALFIKGYVQKTEIDSFGRAYLWRHSGQVFEDSLKEIHLYIPETGFEPKRGGKTPLQPCYLDSRTGYIDFTDDSQNGKEGVLKLYYCGYSEKGRPDVITFPTCPHCKKRMGNAELTSFATRGNLSFFNLIKAQFDSEQPVKGKENKLHLPNQGRKVLLFSDSRQRAARLARDMSSASDLTAARQLSVLAVKRMQDVMQSTSKEQTLNDLYGYFALEAALHNVQMYSNKDREIFVGNHCDTVLIDYKRNQGRRRPWHPSLTVVDNAPDQMREQLLRLFCGNYDTLLSTALCWLSPTEDELYDSLDDLKDDGIEVDKDAFLAVFNAWLLECGDKLALGQTIPDKVRKQVRKGFGGYGLGDDWTMPTTICDVMGWEHKGRTQEIWKNVLQRRFLEQNSESQKLYVDLKKVIPHYDPKHNWYRCAKCSCVTAFPLNDCCPNCGSKDIHLMDADALHALDFWREPSLAALHGAPIRVIDTEEHTAQLSFKDQNNDMWSKTEKYELRFQDLVHGKESPVDILSSTTTMEVGIDIGSLVAVGLRNIPPMRENYQQRAGRAGRRGASLSTIVTYCENGPHDTLYFNNPAPMFRGDPRRPWIDITSEKLVQRHLGMITLQDYLKTIGSSLDSMGAAEFVDNKLDEFKVFLKNYKVTDKILIPDSYGGAADYRVILSNGLNQLKAKKDAHPELYQVPNGVTTKSKSLLDALYEEGIIPTYSFPKNVVSTYISDNKGHTQYQVERGLDVAIGEYAPGRAIVVDKATYQIGGFYYPGSERRKDTRTRPARAFIDDENYKKRVVSCDECGWFGLREDDIKVCPFCGNRSLTESLPMLRPWGFAPKDAKEIPVADLDEQYSYVQQPLYSTLPESETMENVAGYKSLRMASRTNQRIIMVNKGAGGKGFMVCPDCGAAMPGDDPSVLEKVDRPYITVPKFKCSHRDAENLNLGYDFVTDMLVLEISLDHNKVETDREDNLWVNRAGQSLAETIRLVVSRILDVEFTELMTGYRVRKNQTGAYIDVYIYDSLSSGAGYAVAVASVMPEVLERAEALLQGCDCENACYNCLKHYRNQNVHGMLDRFAALDLLNWAKDNSLAPMLSIDMQKKLLAPLGNVLKYADIILSANGDELSVKKNLFHKALKIYPAMWKKPEAKDTIYISDACVKYAKPSAVKKIIDGL